MLMMCLWALAGSGAEGETCLRMRFLRDNPAVLQRYSSDLLALLVQVYSGTVAAQVLFQQSPLVCGRCLQGVLSAGPCRGATRAREALTPTGCTQVKVRCLVAIAKVLQHGTAEQLQALLLDVPLASFVAALLGAREASTLAAAVRLAELLMCKLPELYRRAFRREGVVHAMELLAAGAPPPPPAAARGKERERQAAPKRTSTRAKVRREVWATCAYRM